MTTPSSARDPEFQTLAMKEQVKSGGEVLQELVGRRQREANLLLTGNYGTEE